MLAGKVGLILVALVLSGCDPARHFFGKADPVPLTCSAECTTPCASLVPLPRWQSGTADELRAVLMLDAQICGLPINGQPSVNAAILEQCETRRASCASCLDNLRKNGVIK